LAFTGFTVLPPFISWSASHVGDEARVQYLENYEKRLLSVETTTPIAYPPLEAYQDGVLTEEWKAKKTAERA
jgi:NAD(P)H dehydrogenase (quinone)